MWNSLEFAAVPTPLSVFSNIVFSGSELVRENHQELLFYLLKIENMSTEM